MRGFAYLKNVVTLEYEPERCTGCGMCAHVCPHQVWEMNANRARIRDRDACMECGACALNCPATAIRVESGVGCAAGMIQEWLRDLKIPWVSRQCCSD